MHIRGHPSLASHMLPWVQTSTADMYMHTHTYKRMYSFRAVLPACLRPQVLRARPYAAQVLQSQTHGGVLAGAFEDGLPGRRSGREVHSASHKPRTLRHARKVQSMRSQCSSAARLEAAPLSDTCARVQCFISLRCMGFEQG